MGPAALLCGEMNFPAEAEERARLLMPYADGSPAFLDSWEVLHPGRPHAPTVGVHPVDFVDRPLCYDFCLLTGDLAPRLAAHGVHSGTGASDHQPVWIELADSIGGQRDARSPLSVFFGGVPGEAEPFRTEFLRSLTRRGLRGVKRVISDSHEGLKKTVRKVMHATWQRCRVHFMRNALAHATAGQRRRVPALIGTLFAQETEAAARGQWRTVADQLRSHFPKIAKRMDEVEDDVLAHMAFPREHWCNLRSTNPLERLSGEIKRSTDVVGIFPNEAAIYRLVGALLPEQNDEWSLQRRYMNLEPPTDLGGNSCISLPAVAH